MTTATVSTKLPEKESLAEIYQSMDARMALLVRKGKNDYERVTAFVKCRDFLVDSYTYMLVKKDFGIYGFSFKGSKNSLSMDEVMLQVKFPNEEASKEFRKNLKALHAAEKSNDIPVTEIFEIKDSPDFVVVGDRRWLANCLTFSLYTLLLRVVCYKWDSEWQIADKKASDAAYMKSVSPKVWERILKGKINVLDTPSFCGFDPLTNETHTIHHNSGFISVFGHHTEISPAAVKKNAHWKLMKERGLELHTK